VFGVCNLEGRKTNKTRVIPSRGGGEGPPNCKFDHTIDQCASIRSRSGTHRGSGHRLAQREGVYSWSAIHYRLSNAISDCEVPRRLTRLGMTPFCALNRYVKRLRHARAEAFAAFAPLKCGIWQIISHLEPQFRQLHGPRTWARILRVRQKNLDTAPPLYQNGRFFPAVQFRNGFGHRGQIGRIAPL
jgi:hypothetical protein